MNNIIRRDIERHDRTRLIFGLLSFVVVIFLFSIYHNTDFSGYNFESNADSVGFAFSPVYSGYAVPINGVIVDSNLNFVSSADTISRTIDVSDDIIYRRAYISLDGQAWSQFNLTPTGTLSGEWIYGRGISNIVFSPSMLHLNSSRTSSNNTFIIVYSCSRNVTIHNWSCHDGWQIVAFNARLNSVSSVFPSITFISPTPSSGSTINASSQEIVATVTDGSSAISSWIDFDKSLVGYWSMDYFSLTGIFDNSSYKNFGTFNGGLSMSNIVTGVRGKALSFDGIDDSLNIGMNDLGITNQFTTSAWVYSKADNNGRIISKHSYDSYGWLVSRLLDTQSVEFRISTTGSDWLGGLTSNNSFLTNTWYHIATTYDGSIMRVYINGVEDTGGDFPVSAKGNVNVAPVPLLIGETSNNFYFNGTMDEVMLFNRALSSSEVKALYNSKVNKFDATFTGLSNGQYSYTLYAVDDAGYFAGSEQRTFNVNAATCTQACSGKQCGSDGCSGTCGTCLSMQTCTSSGQCVNNAVIPNCSDGIQNQGETGIDCGGPCTACSTSYSGTVYYVSNSGSDSNVGTSQSLPWQSLTKINGQAFKPGDAILFKRGDVWYGTLTVTSSGSSTAPITYGAYGTGTTNPTISGFSTLIGWTNNGNGVWSKAVSWQSNPNILLFDGVNQPLGRYPHLTSISGWPSSIPTTTVASSTSISSSFIPSSSTNNLNSHGAEIVIRSAGATNDRCLITGHSGNTITHVSTANNVPPVGAGFFIQNHPICLTTLGDWRFENGVIYMYFGSDNPTAHTIKVSTIDNIVDISSKSYVTFDGLTIEGGNDISVSISGGSYDTIKNCNIQYGGNYGIYCNIPSYITITNNAIDQNNNDGIYLTSATHSSVTHNAISNSGMILGMGVTGWSTNEAICIDSGSSSNYNLVSYNNINNSGYDGIRWAGANTEISYNFINRSCQNAADGAGIYSYRGTGANRIVKYNIVLNTMSQPYGWVYQDWTSGNGIYLDGDGGVSILNNVLAHNQGKGLFINSNQGTTAEYNTAYDNSYGIYVFSEPNVNGLDGRARNHIVEYNTLFSKTADQYSLGVVSINAESDLSLFGTIDYNYYARPINIDNYIFREYSAWGGPNQDINLAEMRSQLGYDAHSTVSSASVSDVNNIRFEYNPTTSNKVISLGSNTYVDAKGTSYSGSVTLLPYTAVVLIKT